MNAENRYPVSASLYMLREIKSRQEKVNRGYQLLKRKAEALRLRGRQAASELSTTQGLLGHTLKEAYISLAAIKFTNGESNALVLENIGQAQIRVQRIPENISGVSTVLLRAVEVASVGDVLRYAGLAAGGHRTAEAKRVFRETLLILLKFASLRHTCILLDDALKTTLRKLNGIEKVIMPKLRNTETYIVKEIDEREREEFHRLKMVKAKKKIGKMVTRAKMEESRKLNEICQHEDQPRAMSNPMFQAECQANVTPSTIVCSVIIPPDDFGSLPCCYEPHWDDEDLLF